MKISDRISKLFSDSGESVKTLVKCVVQSRTSSIRPCEGGSLIIMGNGPSLNRTIEEHADFLESADLLAVNFAANTPVFTRFKPEYYVLADPHFFASGIPNVSRLVSEFECVDWPMTLLLPVGAELTFSNPNVSVKRFNMVGAEGFAFLKKILYNARMAMPRPRNVLIPSIMAGIWLGYDKIYIAGADHTWTQTLAVNDRNEVVSVQPHFYTDDKDELLRTSTVYKDVRMHQILESFSIAFKAYHDIARYAELAGVEIINVTPGSFIDAFPREGL